MNTLKQQSIIAVINQHQDITSLPLTVQDDILEQKKRDIAKSLYGHYKEFLTKPDSGLIKEFSHNKYEIDQCGNKHFLPGIDDGFCLVVFENSLYIKEKDIALYWEYMNDPDYVFQGIWECFVGWEYMNDPDYVSQGIWEYFVGERVKIDEQSMSFRSVIYTKLDRQ